MSNEANAPANGSKPQNILGLIDWLANRYGDVRVEPSDLVTEQARMDVMLRIGRRDVVERLKREFKKEQ